MVAKLTIIGLGQIGASVGLALAEHRNKITCVGHDREPDVARRAQEMGAVEKIFHNLPASVENSDFVLLALPFNQIHDTLTVIGPCLRANTVVMDTSPVKRAVAEWMKEYLPPTCYYVGLTPAINPRYLREEKKGVEAAHPDLFINGLMAIASPQGTVTEAVKLAADLAALLGVDPYFIDLAEVDGMMTVLHIMPQLSAAAFANMVMDRPGWMDARKLAGRVFAEATLPVACGDEDEALVEEVLQNQANVLQVLNEMINTIQELKENVSIQERGKLTSWLDGARQGRSKWLRERSAGDWQTADIGKTELLKMNPWKRMFGDLRKLFSPPKPAEREDKK